MNNENRHKEKNEQEEMGIYCPALGKGRERGVYLDRFHLSISLTVSISTWVGPVDKNVWPMLRREAGLSYISETHLQSYKSWSYESGSLYSLGWVSLGAVDPFKSVTKAFSRAWSDFQDFSLREQFGSSSFHLSRYTNHNFT